MRSATEHYPRAPPPVARKPTPAAAAAAAAGPGEEDVTAVTIVGAGDDKGGCGGGADSADATLSLPRLATASIEATHLRQALSRSRVDFDARSACFSAT